MRSILTIHCTKLVHNLNAVKAQLKDGVKVYAVVKDNAYGHGIEGIAKYLAPKVDGFCVARVEEGITLRTIGIQNPILVFELPELEKASWFKEHNLIATVGDINDFDTLVEGTQYHINFDTGMGRLGIPYSQYELAIEKYKSSSQLTCTGIYTHFATADVANSEGVVSQLARFTEVRKVFPSNIMAHTANTGAIFNYSDLEIQFDAVRPGVCLYGYAPGSTKIDALIPVIEWESHILQTRAVQKGDTIGYGASWVAPEDGYIGTVPVGYSDGIQRRLGGKIQLKVNGKLYPQVGRITMDYIGIFTPTNDFHKGDKVTLLNDKELSAEVWAQLNETIPYEVTTALNSRIKRVFKD